LALDVRSARYKLGMSDDFEASVRALRAQGHSPKEIARALEARPAEVAELVRAIAAEQAARATEPALAGCWVNREWSVGLSIEGHPEWREAADARGPGGLASVLVARERDRRTVSVCGYLVDVFCLGVKDALGPRRLAVRDLAGFVERYFRAYPSQPLAVSLELAQHLVLGAVEFAHGLGFAPHRDFAAARGHLGDWRGPSAISFGRHGKPLFVQGERDDAARILATLERSVGKRGFDFIMPLGGEELPRGVRWAA
jgi:hypothetical protein